MSKATFMIEGFAAEPKHRVSQSGKRMLDISVAHTERRKNKQTGQWENATDRDGNEITLWARATFFDDVADLLAGAVSKGTLVRVEGMPRLNVYVTNQGETRANIDVQYASLSIVPRPAPQQGSGGSWGAGVPQQSPRPVSSPQGAAQDAGDWGQEAPF